MMTFEIRTFLPDGSQDKIAPGVQFEFTDEYGTEGYVKATAPGNSLGYANLAERAEVAVFLDGVELPASRALLVEHTGNVTEGDDAPGTADSRNRGGKTLFSRLRKAIVYPQNYPTLDPPSHTFTVQTPGSILKTLIQRAQARGALSTITHATWNATTDSAGVAWARTVTMEYDAGTTLLGVVESSIAQGEGEPRFVGSDLSLYDGQVYVVDRGIQYDAVVLRRATEVT